jgi:hypothetical protein
LANHSSAAYNRQVPKSVLAKVGPAVALLSLSLFAQQAPQSSKPEVKVNYLNVCTPSDHEKEELTSALARLPLKAKFSPDFEISRGRSTSSEPPVVIAEQALPSKTVSNNQVSNWVRVRREFPPDSPFISVQYTLSTNGRGAVETLVFRARDPKDILQISLEAKTTSGDANSLLKTDTPADRIRLERYGKSSVALARCPAADQSAYQPVFREGSVVLARYRDALAVRQIVPGDLRRLVQPASAPKPATKPGPTGQ